MDQLSDFFFQLIGLKGTSLLVVLIITSMVCQVISRLIPDDATGWRKAVKTIAGVVGLHVANRITTGITIQDVAREIINDLPKRERPVELVERVDERISQAEPPDELELDDSMRHVVPAFPGLLNRETPDETP